MSATRPPQAVLELPESLDARIEVLESALNEAYARRGGTRDADGRYWCKCGRETVDAENGEDTCHRCLGRI